MNQGLKMQKYKKIEPRPKIQKYKKRSQGRSPVVDFDWQEESTCSGKWLRPLPLYSIHNIQSAANTNTEVEKYTLFNLLTPPVGVKCMLGPPQLPFLSAWKRKD